jgi:hypothetical protein
MIMSTPASDTATPVTIKVAIDASTRPTAPKAEKAEPDAT